MLRSGGIFFLITTRTKRRSSSVKTNMFAHSPDRSVRERQTGQERSSAGGTRWNLPPCGACAASSDPGERGRRRGISPTPEDPLRSPPAWAFYGSSIRSSGVGIPSVVCAGAPSLSYECFRSAFGAARSHDARTVGGRSRRSRHRCEAPLRGPSLFDTGSVLRATLEPLPDSAFVERVERGEQPECPRLRRAPVP